MVATAKRRLHEPGQMPDSAQTPDSAPLNELPLNELLEEFLIRLVSGGDSESMDSLVDIDMTFSQARTTFMLAQACDPVPIHEIADRLGLSMATAGRNVDQLVKINLVDRRESAEDRRVKLVSLSEAGHKLARQHFDAKRHYLADFADRLTPKLRQSLSDALVPILAGDFLQSTKREHCL